MPRFFTEETNGTQAVIRGDDAAHIAKVLRMGLGESLTVCDCAGHDHLCRITEVSPKAVLLEITETLPSQSEPSVEVILYQALPKTDKMELIVQKCVELGVKRVVPVLTSRCVSRPDEKALKSKVERWGRIASEAAKQCGRGLLPEVTAVADFKQAVAELARHEQRVLFYERAGGFFSQTLDPKAKDFGIMVGPEGGFDEAEAEYAAAQGVALAGLGPRILRTETAPICALSVIMYATGNL